MLHPLAGLWSQGIGAGQAIAVAEERQKAVRLCVVVVVRGRLGHLGQGSGGAEGALGGADRRRLGVRVDDVGDGLVVGLAGFAENVGGDDLALVLAHVGQQAHAGDVTDGPQTVAEAQVGVDRQAVLVGLDADRVEADPVDGAVAGPWR